MKKLGFLLLLLSWPAWATTTVTGNIKTLGVSNVSSGSFVRFWLRGCAGNQPRITGTGIIGPSQGGVFYFDFPANGSGAISGTLYSTRDNPGTGNGEIECGGSYQAVWYGMQAFSAGKGGPEVPIHAKINTTLDISNVTPITTNPVVTSPTGDTTYLRLDAGNSPITGPLALNTTLSVGGLATLSAGLSATIGTFTLGLNEGVAGNQGTSQTVNTKLGAGAQHVVNYLTQQSAITPTSQNEAHTYSETIGGTGVPGSSTGGDVVADLVAGTAVSPDWARTQAMGANFICRLAGSGWASLNIECRTTEFDYVNNSLFDAVFNSSAANGDRNHTGINVLSNGTNRGGIGVIVSSNTRAQLNPGTNCTATPGTVANPCGSWQQGILVDAYVNNGIHVVGDSSNQLVIDTVTDSTANSLAFAEAGTTLAAVQTNSAKDFDIQDVARGVNRFYAELSTNGNTRIASVGSGSVNLNVNSGTGTGGAKFGDGAGNTKASISSAGLLRASQAIADQGTACTNGELALSAGWQSTGSATVTNVKGTGQTCEWTITTGTTTAANPTVTDTLTNALPTANTVCWMIITGGNRTPAAGDSFDQTTLSATAPVFTFQGTPTAGGKTYQVVRACGP